MRNWLPTFPLLNRPLPETKLGADDYKDWSIPELFAGRRGGANAHRFNPNQPRVPAGNTDGGQWTSGTGSEWHEPTQPFTFAAARRRGMSEAFCTAQYAIDILLCNSLRSSRSKIACRSQAAERYAAC
jgi:hypothetical protein